MQPKSREAYEELFRNLNLQGQHIMFDFRTAVRTALIVVFGNVIIIQGCSYHLTLSMWHKIQELGLVQEYI